MIAAIEFEFPAAFCFVLPIAALLWLGAVRQRRSGLGGAKVLALCGLRAVALGALVFLATRPVWIGRQPPASASTGTTS